MRETKEKVGKVLMKENKEKSESERGECRKTKTKKKTDGGKERIIKARDEANVAVDLRR